jgi:uncharacterized protein with NAD-binding domain and iron-sulfur cluster
VLGGGVAGMNAALRLADRGFKVFLAERNGRLGGVAALIRRNLEGDDIQAFVQVGGTGQAHAEHRGDHQRHRGRSFRHAG